MLYINNVPYRVKLFPNKEKIFKTFDITNDINIITLFFENDSDIFDLMMVVKYLNDIVPALKKELVIPYLPYSRMDRVIEKQLFSLKYFAQIINDMHFDKVKVLDLHSMVSLCHIKNLEEIEIEKIVDLIFPRCVGAIMLPDKGASLKYEKRLPNICKKFQIIHGEKSRNTLTGEIYKFEILESDIKIIENKNILIIDDICSKGGTFIHAASLLKKYGAKKVFLFVSHLEDAVFEGELLKTDLIQTIFTTDSIIRRSIDSKIYTLGLFKPDRICK